MEAVPPVAGVGDKNVMKPADLTDRNTELEARVRALEAELQARESDGEAFELAQKLVTHVLLLEKVPLFKPLNAREMIQIASKLLPRSYADGDHVVTLGDTGNAMFIVEAGGALAVSEQGASLKEYRAGDFFGELSLVDDGPRRATVLAVGATKCLELRRDDFHMLKDRCERVLQQFSADYQSRSEKLQAYKEFLKEMEYFKGLSARALLRLAAQVKQVKYEHDEHVIIEGDEDGQEMYILETGIAIATIVNIGAVKIYRRGDAFGELALITDAPRAATITCQGPATFLMLRREDFNHKAVQAEVGDLFRQKLAKNKKDTEKAQAQKRDADIALVTEAMVGDGDWSASPAAEDLVIWLGRVAGCVGLSATQQEAMRSRLEDLGAEVVEDLLILAESEDVLLELELGIAKGSSAGRRLWDEVKRARGAENRWLHERAEVKVRQRKAEEEARRRLPQTALQRAAERRRLLAGIAPDPERLGLAMMSPSPRNRTAGTLPVSDREGSSPSPLITRLSDATGGV